MAKMSMPKKEDDFVLLPLGQKKTDIAPILASGGPPDEVFYQTLLEAQTAGKAIKASHPILQIGIYDAEESQVTLITS